MAITYVGAATAGTTNVNLPAGWAVGDVAIVFALRSNDTSNIGTPSGWISNNNFIGNSSMSARLGYRVLQSGDTSTGTWSSATGIGVVIFTGTDTTQPINAAFTDIVINGLEANNTISTNAFSGGAGKAILLAITDSNTSGADSISTATFSNLTSALTDQRFGVAETTANSASAETYGLSDSSDWATVTVPLNPATPGYPQVMPNDTKDGTQTSNSTSWTLTYPTNIAAGDLLLAFVATDGNPTVSSGSINWRRASGNGNACSIATGFRKCDGSETGNFTLTLSASEQGAWRIFRISAGTWEDHFSQAGTWDASSGDSLAFSAFGASGATSTPDPPSVSPGWGSLDILWFATIGVDTSRTISAYPSNMADRNTADVSGGSTGATLGLALSNTAASSLDPATFTISASDDWGADTVAVKPVVSATTVTTYAQAQAKINTTSVFGQAQAKITTTRVFAQANADIKATTNQFAQGQADIKVTSNQFAQAQATLLAWRFAQAQTDIKATTNVFSQAQADIKALGRGFAQAQAKLGGFTTYGQAQADIKVISRGFAQANADIKATINAFSQAQTDIEVTSNVFAQAQGRILQVYQGFAQAQADIKAVTNVFAQSQADIKQTSNAFAQANADIKVTTNNFAQANADIKVTSNSSAQAQAQIYLVQQLRPIQDITTNNQVGVIV